MIQHPENTPSNSGFTLVELAIVIVIIGFLIAGVLVGKELMRSGQMRTMMADLSRYETALITFRDKFTALPGDMPNATGTWGSAGGDGTNAACQNTASTTMATCNGNGDGVIGTSVVNLDETARAWQHLKNAELIEGVFTGTTNGMTVATLLERTMPPSKKGNAGYQFFTETKGAEGWVNIPELTAPLPAIRVAAPTVAGGGLPVRLASNALSPFDVLTIDDKIDDGRPGTGKVYVHFTGHVNCVTGNDAVAARYVVNNAATSERIGCIMHYYLTK